jgi:hypothetical protein
MKNSTPGKSGSSSGWSGKILQVDLTNGSIREEEISEELKSGYTGGAGINARLLYDALRKNLEIDPLSPENPLIFGFGLLVGTSFPCSSRMTITAKSPLTRIFGDSNGGGTFPARVKQAGYDHIVFRGKAAKPVALLIEKGKHRSWLMQLICGALTPMRLMRRYRKNTASVKQPASGRQEKIWSGMQISATAPSASASMADPAWAASWAPRT